MHKGQPMKLPIQLSLISTMLVAIMNSPAFANNDTATKQQRAEHWQSMSAEQKAAANARHEKFKNMSPQKQQRLRDRREKFKNMPKEQRQKMREKYNNTHQKKQN